MILRLRTRFNNYLVDECNSSIKKLRVNFFFVVANAKRARFDEKMGIVTWIRHSLIFFSNLINLKFVTCV